MSDCPKLPKCSFFNDKMSRMPGLAEIFKQNYCRGDNTECARLFVATRLGPEFVPFDLYPNGRDRAKQIVAAQESLSVASAVQVPVAVGTNIE